MTRTEAEAQLAKGSFAVVRYRDNWAVPAKELTGFVRIIGGGSQALAYAYIADVRGRMIRTVSLMLVQSITPA